MTTRMLRLWPCLAVLLALGLPVLTRAATLNVPSAAYPTIQSGVDASHDGDTVQVADGTYTGDGNRDIDFHGINVTVTSQNGPTKTIIDCGGHYSDDGSGDHRGFYIHSGETKAAIIGFTVKNGYESYISYIYYSIYGGGICIHNSSAAISNCTITGDTAYNGGGVYSECDSNNTVTLNSCIVTENTTNANGSGGGISNENIGGTIALMRFPPFYVPLAK